jgi:hypothetical protein
MEIFYLVLPIVVLINYYTITQFRILCFKYRPQIIYPKMYYNIFNIYFKVLIKKYIDFFKSNFINYQNLTHSAYFFL